jgi:hypothetical protein
VHYALPAAPRPPCRASGARASVAGAQLPVQAVHDLLANLYNCQVRMDLAENEFSRQRGALLQLAHVEVPTHVGSDILGPADVR